MTTDLELLEAAARAAGHKVARWSDDELSLLLIGEQDAWSSLASNDDAFQLQVALQMDVFVRAEWVEAVAPMGSPQKVRYGHEGPLAAARRAITLAAAVRPPKRAAMGAQR